MCSQHRCWAAASRVGSVKHRQQHPAHSKPCHITAPPAAVLHPVLPTDPLRARQAFCLGEQQPQGGLRASTSPLWYQVSSQSSTPAFPRHPVTPRVALSELPVATCSTPRSCSAPGHTGRRFPGDTPELMLQGESFALETSPCQEQERCGEAEGTCGPPGPSPGSATCSFLCLDVTAPAGASAAAFVGSRGDKAGSCGSEPLPSVLELARVALLPPLPGAGLHQPALVARAQAWRAPNTPRDRGSEQCVAERGPAANITAQQDEGAASVAAGWWKGKARREVGCTWAFQEDARTLLDKHTACSPVSCLCTNLPFHLNLLIPLKRQEGFCSSTHVRTPHIHVWKEAKAGRCCPNGWLCQKSTSAWKQVVLAEIIWQLRHMAGSGQELQ